MTTTPGTTRTSTNWARNLVFAASEVVHPRTPDELERTVRGARRVKALGSRHSFDDVADTTGTHVVLDAYDDGRPPVDVDPATGVASVAAGLRYGDVTRHVQAAGRALPNLASLPHISVAGSVATATHGSGDGVGSLASAVVGLELVTGDGETRTLRRGDADFPGAVVALGALGIVTRLELETVPTFDVRQDVHVDLPWDAVAAHLDALTASAYSVSLFTDWGADGVQQVWRKSRIAPGERGEDPPADLFGARPAREQRHPLPGVDPVHCTAQLGEAGPWNERLPHFRLDFTPSNGDELQSEYLVPRRHALAALEAMRGLGPRLTPLLQVGEIRTVAADPEPLWLSPFDGPTVAFHLTWKPLPDDVARVLPDLESALARLGARPHWGKLSHAVTSTDPAALAAVAARYPRLAEFRALAERLDPDGRFRGGFVGRLLAR
ncbi:FAD-binding protein [Cellulosimicrobium sp. CUA-896]|uniref:FAD-binding protein n=1 Tax=Cellulosimicrobium sp. CUA-896 TaxID=1517881 RepID=UPI00095B3771|nr:FAD-binding protein [Cellulosimicrobium sp. CUA-896]OLT49038.1 FAD-binding protein [Cellulosimicrobium sp. CUA-896]